MVVDLRLIQYDLNNGMSIGNVCDKYNITFRQLWQISHGHSRKQVMAENKNKPVEHRYILERRGIFSIRKSVNGHTRMFGSYDSLEDALLMREALKQDGWKQTHVDRLCHELGIQRRTGQINEKVRYH